jgi:lipopolysaccharide export system protein LptA
MIALYDTCAHGWTGRGLFVLGVVLLGAVWTGGAGARAQAVPDTAAAVTPAAPAPLPMGEVVPPAPDTGTTERAFVEADSLSTLQQGGERLQELFGNVFVRQDTTRLRSRYALRYLERDELLFVGDVVIYERGDTLRADTVRYDRATEVGRARGRVRLTNGDVTVRSDRATYYASDKRSVFPDSVTLIDSTRVLRAASGTYWSDEERAVFGGGVRLTEPGTLLHSDSLTYYRAQGRSIARGNVFIDRRGDRRASADTTGSEAPADSIRPENRTYLFGAWVDNQEQRRYSRVEGRALLMRVGTDSSGASTDTLVVAAHRLEAFRTDTHRRLVAVDSVRIWQPRLSAVADSAVYDRVVRTMPAERSDSMRLPIDTLRPVLDSVARASRPSGAGPSAPQSSAPPRAAPSPPAASTARPVRTTRRWSTPVARADSVLPLEETRLFRSPVAWFEGSQVWGDSIRIRARSRRPDTVFVRGSAFAAQRDSALNRIQQLKARHLSAFFRADSLRRIRARPNAQAIRFLATQADSLNGAARTSGDRIDLRFKAGTVRRIRVVGGTETTYYRKPANIPDPFQLDGFQWTPDQRPTRRLLFRDARVRRWLHLRPPPQPAPSDSLPRAARPTSSRLRPGPGIEARGREAAPIHPCSSSALPQRPRHVVHESYTGTARVRRCIHPHGASPDKALQQTRRRG